MRRPGQLIGGALAIAAALSWPASAAEQVANGGFDAGIENWWATDNMTLQDVGGLVCVTVPGGLTNPWDAIVGQDGIALEQGQGYALSFTAAGEPRGPLKAIVQMPSDPYTAYVTEAAELGQELVPYDASFEAPESRDDAQLVFQLGGADEEWTFCLDDVSLQGGAAVEGYSAETGSSIRVNQLGYLPDGPKKATVVSDSPEPMEFTVADDTGETVYSGKTEPKGIDKSAGHPVHVADFSDIDATGEGFTLTANGETSYPFAIREGLYADLPIDALKYFYLARSGIEIDADLAGEDYARPAGHISSPDDGDANKGDRDVPCLPAETSEEIYGEPWTCDYTLSPVGGWYDAGDHGKYVVNGGISVSQLMTTFEWARMAGAAETYADDSLPVPETGNDVPDILDEARWELDFIEAMIVPDGEDRAGMVHHKIHDDAWTGLPLLPDRDDQPRHLHRPSTAATLNASAVFAQAARVFEPYDADYAAHALDLAKTTWRAAMVHSLLRAPPEDGTGGGSYADDDVDDEYYWAAAELFITTGDDEWLDFMKSSGVWNADVYRPGGFDWRDVGAYVQLQLAMHAGMLSEEDAKSVRKSLTGQADELLERLKDNPFGHAYVPLGGAYDWGSNHMIAQNGLILAAAYELTDDDKYRDAAIENADYLLGRNALDRSYITGYGTVFSQNQHSRWFSAQLDPSLPHPPKGSLAGGPNSSIDDPKAQELFAQGCAAQTCYVDDIESWSTNEITINWNAALAQYASWLARQ